MKRKWLAAAIDRLNLAFRIQDCTIPAVVLHRGCAEAIRKFRKRIEIMLESTEQ